MQNFFDKSIDILNLALYNCNEIIFGTQISNNYLK